MAPMLRSRGKPAPAEPSYTFLFADLADVAGFTALAERTGDSDAAELAQRFHARAAPLIETHGGEQVEVIRDAIVVRTDAAPEALLLGLRLVQEIGGERLFPTLRVGLHPGPGVQRGAESLGATVTLAFRVSREAGAGEVLLTDATRHAAGPMNQVDFHRRGRLDLENEAEPMTLHAAVRIGAHVGERLDPVCRVVVHPEHAGRLVHDSHQFYFCSLACAAKFARAPESYLDSRPHLRLVAPTRQTDRNPRT